MTVIQKEAYWVLQTKVKEAPYDDINFIGKRTKPVILSLIEPYSCKYVPKSLNYPCVCQAYLSLRIWLVVMENCYNWVKSVTLLLLLIKFRQKKAWQDFNQSLCCKWFGMRSGRITTSKRLSNRQSFTFCQSINVNMSIWTVQILQYCNNMGLWAWGRC